MKLPINKKDVDACLNAFLAFGEEDDTGIIETILKAYINNDLIERKELATVEEIEKIVADFFVKKYWYDPTRIKEFRKPTHGSCCTCQVCGYSHDDCVCEEIETRKEIGNLAKALHGRIAKPEDVKLPRQRISEAEESAYREEGE